MEITAGRRNRDISAVDRIFVAAQSTQSRAVASNLAGMCSCAPGGSILMSVAVRRRAVATMIQGGINSESTSCELPNQGWATVSDSWYSNPSYDRIRIRKRISSRAPRGLKNGVAATSDGNPSTAPTTRIARPRTRPLWPEELSRARDEFTHQRTTLRSRSFLIDSLWRQALEENGRRNPIRTTAVPIEESHGPLSVSLAVLLYDYIADYLAKPREPGPNEDHVVGCNGETAGEGRQGSRRGAGRDRDHDAPKNCWPSDHAEWPWKKRRLREKREEAVRARVRHHCGVATGGPCRLQIHDKKRRLHGPDEVLRAFSEGPPGKILLLGGDFMLHEGIRGGWPRNEGSDGGIVGQIVESGPRSELGPEPDPGGTAQDTPANSG
ncbi:hypothetical protein THAOC_09157 [Thalassiosira oceanica]|uniref:Uncharacterized protein n=1 Tax=Thalassiosira oceanica TaxID=159749 RepID=K0SVW5_THAOC|nr:hypothetical protein THAOC_09157 [Thalassiosira oceanica]|eukprot:EJK69570.1 hypothetical protein THAOC_09157 [Thalassiosira oceanica]